MVEDNLVKDSTTLGITFAITAILGGLFHFSMGRLLGPTDYGILGTILALTYIIFVYRRTIESVTRKSVAQLIGDSSARESRYVVKHNFLVSFFVGVAIFVTISLLLNPLSSFLSLQAEYLLIPLTAVIPAGCLSVMYGLQFGVEDFREYGKARILEFLLKLSASVGLVYLGYGIYGPLAGIILSISLVLLYLVYKYWRMFKLKYISSVGSSSHAYSLATFFSYLFLTLIYNIDILLVKHFFASEQAGFYSSASMLSRFIFLGSNAIAFAVFPKVTRLKASESNYSSLLFKSVLLMVALGIPVVLVANLFSSTVMGLFFGSKFLPASPIIGHFAIAMTLLGLNNVLMHYDLALGKKKVSFILLVSVVIELLMIYFYHSSLIQVVHGVEVALVTLLALNVLSFWLDRKD